MLISSAIRKKTQEGSQGLQLREAKVRKEWCGTGKSSLHTRVLALSKVIMNVRHEEINPDILLGKAGSPI